ncbi:AI-2E family transporter [Paracoccus sp. DMF-8]|uniref:AI-2E family transporter n=1 Tax=Paracoccus sp. DMF-8 TaxID=3019445 RepID=UPI0023E755C5|nr:AI-2E family transporter [Paracoccus sp. DMF-8]MDF3605299.1 AI-2E family transporter [Paracoccus sp. DMF-8]
MTVDDGDNALRQKLQTGFLGVIAFAVILFLLVQAKFLLITLSIAIIIFSLTSDAISAFARLRVPTWFATTLALAVITIGLLWVVTALVAQVNEIVSTAISYAERAQKLLPQLTEWAGPNATVAIDSFIRSLDLTGWIRSLAAQASNLVSGVVMVLVFVGFMFSERIWFPIKIERLTSDPVQADKVQRIISSIMRRVNRYLVVKTLVSVVTAALVWLTFRLAGLELAGPIAVITFILNFIPTIGSIVATIIAILLALAQTGSVGETVAIGAICTAIQFLIGNVIDPMLLGQTLRMSTFGIVLSLAVWGAVWGLPGMFLSVPIMAAVMIICAHIPWLRPLAIILSREGLADENLFENDARPASPAVMDVPDLNTTTTVGGQDREAV